MNKERKFKVAYKIIIEGRSRGREGEPTFMEALIKKMLVGFVAAIINRFKNVGMKVEKL